MTGPRIDVGPRILSGDEWEQQQYLTKSAPKAAKGTETTPLGRVLTGDEWEEAQRLPGPALKKLRIPLLPTIPKDVTRTPMDPTAKGKPLAVFDIKDPTTYANPILRQVINPAMENPFTTAAMGVAPFAAAGASPALGIAAAVGMTAPMVWNIAKYGYTKASEMSMAPELRAKSEADPHRVSGEAAAVQAAMLGLAPLIHVGVKGYRNLDVSPGMMEAGARAAGEAGAMRVRPGFDDAHRNADFVGTLDATAADAYARAGNQPARPKGLETFESSRTGAGAKPVDGLETSETVKAGKVKPVETLPANATLAEKAAYNEAVREYEAKRLVQEQEELSAARAKDAEKIARADAMRPGRREKAAFFESEQGAEVLGMTAARHGLAPDASPYIPETPLDVAWKNGHTATTESFPEGFSMGGSLKDSRIPAASEVPKAARGVDGVVGLEQSHPFEFPEGFTDENAALAAALKPSRFRAHTVDELTKIAIEARDSIDRAQSGIDAGGDMIRDKNGNIVRNLRYVGVDDLHSELARLSELNANEHAAYASVTDAGYRETYHNLPDTERVGRRGQEDLPDADGAIDPERLLADNRIVADYNRNHVVRAARERAIERIQREIDARGGETSFDFGANAEAGFVDEAPLQPSAHERDMIRAKSTLTQVERELAMRGITGDDLAQRIAAAKGEPPAPVTEPVAAGAGSARGLAEVAGTGEVRTRGLSAGVEAKAVAAKLDAAMGDLPEYRQISMADQAAKAADLLDADPALARRVALGEAPAPDGLLPESVFVAVENRAIAQGDVATIRDLATGKLTSEATTMGQRIRALGERDPDSPIAAIKSVVDARTKSVKGGVPKATLETVAQIKAQLQGLKVTPDAWSAFIESLKC